MSDFNVVSLPNPINETCVARLTELLDMARSGRLQDVAACGTLLDGTVITALSSTQNAVVRLAAVARLQHRMHVIMDGDMKDV